ncbi:MAG: response regulator [Abitibacteriaceae bacterium]|nr:response regulator [Abditibacteriaceae bacterium]
MLAYLAYHFPYAHRRDELVDHLWPDCELEAGRNRLRVTLTHLRQDMATVGSPGSSVLQSGRTCVGLNPDCVSTDLAEFDRLLKLAESTPIAGDRMKLLDSAIKLYHGPAMAGYYESWVVAAQMRVEVRFFQALTQLIEDSERANELQKSLEYARYGLCIDPVHEGIHREVMRLYAVSGNPTAALKQYHDLERTLSDMGDRPSPATRELARNIEAQAVQLKSTPKPPVDARYRILIIEDDPGLANIIRLCLGASGFECCCAFDATTGLATFHQMDPHLVLLDLVLPDLSGREICRRIRHISNVPIIMMTQLSHVQDQLQGFKLGADEYVTKPFAPELMLARVQALLRRTYNYNQ